MKKYFKQIIFGTSLFLCFVLMPAVGAFAQDDESPTKGRGVFELVSDRCWESGKCTLCDILSVLIYISNGILRLVAIVATVFFVWGAGKMALSNGDEKMVTEGKGVMKATVIGVVVVFVAWQLMSVVVMIMANRSDELFSGSEGARGDPLTNPITAWYKVAESCRNLNPAE